MTANIPNVSKKEKSLTQQVTDIVTSLSLTSFSDGDYGDVTVSGVSTHMNVDSAAGTIFLQNTATTAQIQAALNSFGAAGGVVQLAPGTYTGAWISAPANAQNAGTGRMWLSVPTKVILRGSGTSTILTIACPGAGLVGNMVLFDDCVGSGVEDLQIQGTAVSSALGALIGVRICGASKAVTTRRVLFAGTTAANGCTICYDILNDAAAVDLGYHIVDSCRSTSCIGTASGSGLVFDVNASDNNQITNNHSTFLAADGRHHVYLSGVCRSNLVIGNTLFGGTSYAIQIQNQVTTGSQAEYNVVANNLVKDSDGIIINLNCGHNTLSNNVVISSVGLGIALSTEASTAVCTDNYVVGNYIANATTVGIHVTLGTRSVIEGNTVLGSGTYGMEFTSSASTGFYSEDVVVSNNHISTSNRNGLRSVGAKNCVFKGNTFIGNAVTTTAGGYYSVDFAQYNTGTTFENNYIRSTTQTRSLYLNSSGTSNNIILAKNNFGDGTTTAYTVEGGTTIGGGENLCYGTVPDITVASAATMTLPGAYTDVFAVTGTADITSITTSWDGRVVKLRFTGTRLTNGLVDGSNLLLDPVEGNMAYTPNDTITLLCDGTNWLELSRSSALSVKLAIPITTIGDTVYANTTTTLARLAIGTTGKLLTVVAGIPAWSAPSFTDASFRVTDDGDTTKVLAVECSGIATASTRTAKCTDFSGTLVLVGNTTSAAGTLGYFALTGQTASLGAQTILTGTASSAGLYRLTFYLKTTTAGSAGDKVIATAAFNDGSAQTLVVPFEVGATQTTDHDLATLNAFSQGSVVVKVAASQNITFTTTVTKTGSPQYSLDARIEALG